jgi:hypothetical protein
LAIHPEARPTSASTGSATGTLVFKNNRFGANERFNVQFRAEFFRHMLNRGPVRYPGSNVGQANFGVISTQINRPRQIQFALKLQF